MSIPEWLQYLIGGGGLVGLLSIVLQYQSKKKGSDIDWYDRAVEQVKSLDKEIDELKVEIKDLKAELYKEKRNKFEMERIIKKLEETVSELETQLGEHRKIMEKGKNNGNNNG